MPFEPPSKTGTGSTGLGCTWHQNHAKRRPAVFICGAGTWPATAGSPLLLGLYLGPRSRTTHGFSHQFTFHHGFPPVPHRLWASVSRLCFHSPRCPQWTLALLHEAPFQVLEAGVKHFVVDTGRKRFQLTAINTLRWTQPGPLSWLSPHDTPQAWPPPQLPAFLGLLQALGLHLQFSHLSHRVIRPPS